MNFNTLLFPCFFAAAALVYYLLPRVIRPYLLLAASYAFYVYEEQNAKLVWVLVLVTIITWAAGFLFAAKPPKPFKQILLVFVCAVTLLPLVYFKYSGAMGLRRAEAALVMPLGISYFTFAALSYVGDQCAGKYPPVKNPLQYALFVSFFPSIFTGPIERADHLLPQLFGAEGSPRLRYDNLAGGAFRMLWGYFKKMVLADRLAVFVKAYYTGTLALTGPMQLAAAALFSLQLYFDFSGCCDIAIGGARLFGLRLLENFENPFLATSYSDLWRRWHISLTGWFRSYIYYPLGGSRCPRWRWMLNFMAVFLLSGIWHGAGSGYFWWGALCGALALAERIPSLVLKTTRPGGRHQAEAAASQPLPPTPVAAVLKFITDWLRRILVFGEFSLCFSLFASALYGGKVSPLPLFLTQWTAPARAAAASALTELVFQPEVAVLLPVAMAVVFAVESRGDVAEWIRRRLFVWRWPLYLVLILGLLCFGVYGQSAFIYQMY